MAKSRIDGREHMTPMRSYQKKIVAVRACRMAGPFELAMPGGGSEQGDIGDYLIIDMNGELSICPPAAFAVTYERTD